MTSINLTSVLNKQFHSLYKSSRNNNHLRYVLKGGRGSGKSTFISIQLILDLIKYPITILCVRKVGNTLPESCYEQLKEAVGILKLDKYFHFAKSPLRIDYLPRGNSIIFRGADNPAKIKSIKVSKYPITELWIEELAEFKTEEEVAMIEKSILRAELPKGLMYKFFYSYNPPKRKQSWVNKKYETQFINPNTLINHSTYIDNPYISQAFIDEALYSKERSQSKYEWEYLGKPIGSGVVPFNNLDFRKITDEEIENFDNIRQGIDWGYATDPLAFVRIHYDKKRRRIYVFDEVYEVKLSNRKLSKKIIEKKYNDVISIADSAEPKSIDELKGYGVKIKGAKKGSGSVEFGEKWLDDLDAIIIDPVRCPHTASEFENIDYEVDRFGNVKTRLEDNNNHSIDACRYALSEDMVERKLGSMNKARLGL